MLNLAYDIIKVKSYTGNQVYTSELLKSLVRAFPENTYHLIINWTRKNKLFKNSETILLFITIIHFLPILYSANILKKNTDFSIRNFLLRQQKNTTFIMPPIRFIFQPALKTAS